MSKVFTILAVFLSSMIFTASAEWHVENLGYTGQTPAIALDSSGNPRIACGVGTAARIFTYTGSGWSLDLIYTSSYQDCEYFDIVIDESDIPHVTFSFSGMVSYAMEDPALDSWSVQTFLTDGTWNSLGLSSQGSPGISCYTYAKDLEYLYWTGTAWSTEVIDSSGDTGNYNSLLREGSNKAHIAYSMELPTPGLRYASRNGSGVWQTSFVDTTMSSEAVGMSIALDGDGYPHISYSTTEDLRYASWDGSSWDVETVLSISGDDNPDTGADRYGTSLVLFNDEYPHIAHCTLNSDSLLYSWNDGSGWQTESICSLGFYPEGKGDPDLALDSEGRAHIAFFADNDLYYAYSNVVSSTETVEEAIEPLDFNALANPFYGTLSLSFNLAEAAHVALTVYDLQGREVETLLSSNQPAGSNLCSWSPESTVPYGEYILVLNTNDFTAAQKVVYLK